LKWLKWLRWLEWLERYESEDMDNLIELGLLGVVRFFLWVLLLMFVVFSLVVVRQVQLMNRVLEVPISGGLKLAAWGLLVFAVGIFIISVVVL